MRDAIVKIIADYLDVPIGDLDEHKTLQDLQIDSLDFAEMMFEIEEKFDTSIMFEMQSHKDEMRNLGDVLNLIEAEIVKEKAAKQVATDE